jgi:prophage antirepressor-like protein
MKNDSTLSLVYKGDIDTRAVRVHIENNQPWFVASDLATILGYESAKDALRGLDDEEKGWANMPTPGGMQRVTTVNESGLYTLMVRSKRAEAKPFRKWVTGEVLPSIRTTGSYLAPITEGDPLTLALQAALEARTRLSNVESSVTAVQTSVTNLEQRLDSQPIHGKERRRIRDLCQQLGRELGDYSKAYRLLWDKFELASYTDLPSLRFEEAERFLLGLIAAYTGQDALVSV